MSLALQVRLPPVLRLLLALVVLLALPARSVHLPPAFADHIGPIASAAISCSATIREMNIPVEG